MNNTLILQPTDHVKSEAFYQQKLDMFDDVQ